MFAVVRYLYCLNRSVFLSYPKTQSSVSYQDVLELEVPVDYSLTVYKRNSISDLSRPSTYFSEHIMIPGFCWRCPWVIEDLTLQVSFALFRYHDHSCGAPFLEKWCAIKLYNVRMIQFSDQDNKKHAIYLKVIQNLLYFNCQIMLYSFIYYLTSHSTTIVYHIHLSWNEILWNEVKVACKQAHRMGYSEICFRIARGRTRERRACNGPCTPFPLDWSFTSRHCLTQRK